MTAGRVKRANGAVIMSHWCKLIEGLQALPSAFYSRLQQAISERKIPHLQGGPIQWKEGGPFSANRQYMRLLRERMVIDICAAPFGTGFFVSWRLGQLPLKLNILGMLLLIGLAAWGGYTIYSDYFYRWKLYRLERLYLPVGSIAAGLLLLISLMRCAVGAGLANLDAVLLKTPVIAGFYERFLRPVTYYRIDLALMYEQAVHAAVLQVIDEFTDSQNIPRLADSERKPILRDYYKR